MLLCSLLSCKRRQAGGRRGTFPEMERGFFSSVSLYIQVFVFVFSSGRFCYAENRRRVDRAGRQVGVQRVRLVHGVA